MQKKWIRVLTAFALCALLATTSACATPLPNEPGQQKTRTTHRADSYRGYDLYSGPLSLFC